MSARALSERCAALGYPIARSTLASIENGDRRSVTLPELAAIAAALDVPPVALLYPLDVDEVEVLPGEKVPPFGAIQWFAGEAAGTEGAVKAYDAGDVAEPLRALEELRRLSREGWRGGSGAKASQRLVLSIRERLRAAGISVPRAINEEQVRELEAMPAAQRNAILDDDLEDA